MVWLKRASIAETDKGKAKYSHKLKTKNLREIKTTVQA